MISAGVEALAAGGAAAQAAAALRPAFDAPALRRLVGAGEEDSPVAAGGLGFSEMNGGGFGFKDDGFAHDPFAPHANAATGDQGGFPHDPFAARAGDPFAGDAFAASAAKQPVDPAWEADPFAVLHAPTRASPTPSLPPKRHKTPPPRPAPPRPNPPGKTGMDFAEDPFKDYRYEDPFNIEDPFKDATDSTPAHPAARSASAAIFQPDDLFGAPLNGFPRRDTPSGRVSAPPLAADPFSRADARPSAPAADDWGWKDDWASDDAWAKPAAAASDAWNTSRTDNWTGKTDNWANKTDNWATESDWAADFDQNKNLNETWPSTLPKKEKSPKPVKYAKSLVHTIGGIGRRQRKRGKEEPPPPAPSEEQQWAWAAAESARLAADHERRRRQEDAELQRVLKLSQKDK